jgi:hypothetical protein
VNGVLAGALAGMLACLPALAEDYTERPIYSEPASGLQLPPGCVVEPSWRVPVPASDIDLWVASCQGQSRIWLLRRQVVEVVNGRQVRLRFQVLQDMVLPDEVAGDTLSVQCSGTHEEGGYVVRGARWRNAGTELRLRSARSVLRVDVRNLRLVETEIAAVDCVRFPERENLMKRLQGGRP